MSPDRSYNGRGSATNTEDEHTAAAPPLLLDAALAYAARGWRVIPVQPRGKAPLGHLVPHGLHDGTTDPKVIERWWAEVPDANVGVRTGDLFDVIDIDHQDGARAFADLCRRFGIDFNTLPRSVTGRLDGTGRHVFIELTGRGNAKPRLPHVDFRGAGAYVVAPPSVHASGGRYVWKLEPNGSFPPLGDEALADLFARPDRPSSDPVVPSAVGDAGAYAQRALDAELSSLARAVEGDRNHQLNRSAFSLYQLVAGGELQEADVTRPLTAVARGLGLEDAEISRTLASARDAGGRDPRSATTEKLAANAPRGAGRTSRLLSANGGGGAGRNNAAEGSGILSANGPTNVGTVGAEKRSPRFRTARRVVEDLESRPVDHSWLIAPGFLKPGAITEVDGDMKRAGKTTLVLVGWARAMLVTGDFLGASVPHHPVVLLTDERDDTLAAAIRRAGLEDCDELHILRKLDDEGLPFDAIVALAVEQARAVGARLLIVDTIGRWALGREDSEKDAGAGATAMEPLEQAAAHDLAVLILRHDRKGGGEVGQSGRGTTAITGAADIVIQVTRTGEERPNARTLKCVSRFDETPDQLVVELTADGYISHGADLNVEHQRVTRALVQLLDSIAGTTAPDRTTDQIAAALNAKRVTVQNALTELSRFGRVERVGAGKKGDPYRFRAVALPPASTDEGL